MDYDRYIELYRQGKFQEAVEYKATQVPTRLVKYYSLNDNVTVNKSKLQYLKEQRIFLSTASGFNDPFEGKFFKFDKDNFCGESTCMITPSFNTTILVPSVIASVWSCVT